MSRKFDMFFGVLGIAVGIGGIVGWIEVASPYMVILGQSMILLSAAKTEATE